MRNLLVIALMFVGQWSYAQAPGYMGKRLLVTGEASFFNALFHPNHFMEKGLSSFAVNIRSTIDMDYMVARNGSIGVTFDLIFTGMEYNWSTPEFTRLLIPGIDAGYDHAQIRGYGYGINYKVFTNPSKGGIAPIGGYVKFDVMVLDTRIQPYNKQKSMAMGHEERVITPMLSLTYGRQRVFFDFLVLRSGVQVGIVPTGIGPYIQLFDGELGKPDQATDLRAQAEARLFSYYLLNFNVGIGFLAPIRKKYK